MVGADTNVNLNAAAQPGLAEPERAAIQRWLWLYLHDFATRDRPRLLFAWWLAQTGRLGEWPGSGPRLTPDLHPWGSLSAAPSAERPPCHGCGAELAEIVYGLPPWPLPGGCIMGGLAESGDDPAYACLPCRRYADDDGAPYRGAADPLDLG